MPRLYKSDAEVDDVIAKLGRLYTGQKSLKKLSEFLSNNSENPSLHPNRLLSLLNGNKNQSLNETTVIEIKKSLEKINLSENEDLNFQKKISEEFLRLESQLGDREQALKKYVETSKVPREIIERFSQTHEKDSIEPKGQGDEDWTWQDKAINETLRVLINNPGKNVGLIIPTGGGKTRVTCEILYHLIKENIHDKILWIAHRKFLIRQARDEFEAMLKRKVVKEDNIDPDKIRDSVVFQMINTAKDTSSDLGASKYSFLVIDEAHHAAANSYHSFLKDSGLHGLFLTATPTRMDGKPIGIDLVGYQTTYRELIEKRCIIKPEFFEYSLNNSNSVFDTNETLETFANTVLSNLETHKKSLVAVLTKIQAEELSEAIKRIYNKETKLFSIDYDDIGIADIGFATGEKQNFLDEFKLKSRGILIATAPLISEGFDDRSIDSVYITYESKSISNIMQTAGRALRKSDGKSNAAIYQVVRNDIDYFFNYEWLISDITDKLRPRVFTVKELTVENRVQKFKALCENNGWTFSKKHEQKLIEQLSEIPVHEKIRIMLAGLINFKNLEYFKKFSEWNPILIREKDDQEFVNRFNRICSEDEIEDKKNFLIKKLSLNEDDIKGSYWYDLLEATNGAKDEILINQWSRNRGRTPSLGTTWLVNINFEPESKNLQDFLSDCINGQEISSSIQAMSEELTIIKFAEPISMYEAFIFKEKQMMWIDDYLNSLTVMLGENSEMRSWDVIQKKNKSLDECPINLRVLPLLPQLLRKENIANQQYKVSR